MRRAGVYSQPKFRDPQDLRLVDIIKAGNKPAPQSVNILGIPFDGAVLGRRGAAGGPAAIRSAMSGFSNYDVEMGLGFEGARICDLGDLEVDPEDVSKAHVAIKDETIQDLNDDSLLILLGGDNSASLPALNALGEKFGEIGLIVIDSHFDLRGKIAGKPSSGSSYGLALEEIPGLDAKRVVEIGIHGFLNSKKYAMKAKRLGIGILTAEDVRRRGPAAVATQALRKATKGAKAVYLSVDLDAVDVAQVSGVSAPSAGGIGSRELFELVHKLTRSPMVKCADIVELAPSLDPTGRSQLVAATALVYMIAGFHSRLS